MADILTTLQQFLCYGNQGCISEFYQYANQPIEGLFYLVFFPSIYIIIFIYLISSKLFAEHRGLKLIISVAIFAFIILQGWYHLFMIIGKMWLISLVILGVFWMALFALRGGLAGGGGGASGGAMRGGGGPLEKLMNISRQKLLKEEEDKAHLIEADLRVLESMDPNSVDIGRLTGRIVQNLTEMRNDTSFYGLRTARGKYDNLRNEYFRIAKSKGVSVNKKSIPK